MKITALRLFIVSVITGYLSGGVWGALLGGAVVAILRVSTPKGWGVADDTTSQIRWLFVFTGLVVIASTLLSGMWGNQ